MTVMDVAREDVVTVSPGDPARDVARTMEEADVGSVVVVRNRRPVGIVTDRDLALQVVGGGADPTELAAGDVMAEDLFTAEADEGIYEVLERMRETGVRRVPVVDDEEVVGIVTLDDFVVLLSSELDSISEVVQAESPPY